MKKLLIKTTAFFLMVIMLLVSSSIAVDAATVEVKNLKGETEKIELIDSEGNYTKKFTSLYFIPGEYYDLLKKKGAYTPTSWNSLELLKISMRALSLTYDPFDFLYSVSRTNSDNNVEGTQKTERDFMILVKGMENVDGKGFNSGEIDVVDSQMYLKLIDTVLRNAEYYNEQVKLLEDYKKTAQNDEIEAINDEIDNMKYSKDFYELLTAKDYEEKLKSALVEEYKIKDEQIQQNFKITIRQAILDVLSERFGKDLSKYKVFKNHTTNEFVINTEEDRKQANKDLLNFGYYILNIKEDDLNKLNFVAKIKFNNFMLEKVKDIFNVEISEKVSVDGKEILYWLTLCKEPTDEKQLNGKLSWYWVPDWLLHEDFNTRLRYTQKVDGVEVKGTDFDKDGAYLAQYKEDNNGKTDPDVKAIIQSGTPEKIVKVNGIDLKEDGTPNSQGWYYIEKDELTAIAKDYKFDDYNNTTNNGIVNPEKVTITGELGETTEETVYIKWTFRVKLIDKKQNDDGSTTVTIEYNLPIDPASIPSGWSPVYDKDGKTVHKITKNIPKGQNYDADITIKQNGTGVQRTTHITVEEKKEPVIEEDKTVTDKVIPQAGQKNIIICLIIVATIILIVAYSKNKKSKF